MSISTLLEFVEEAIANLPHVEGIPEGYSPFQGHLRGDGDTKSRFHLDTVLPGCIMAALHDLLGNGLQGPIFITSNTTYEVGELVVNEPIPEEVYEMTCPHGNYLQAKGKGKLTRTPTREFTLVLTPENIVRTDDFKEKGLALASVFPGRPDKAPDTTGLKEGDKVTGAELLRRGFVRVY